MSYIYQRRISDGYEKINLFHNDSTPAMLDQISTFIRVWKQETGVSLIASFYYILKQTVKSARDAIVKCSVCTWTSMNRCSLQTCWRSRRQGRAQKRGPVPFAHTHWQTRMSVIVTAMGDSLLYCERRGAC